MVQPQAEDIIYIPSLLPPFSPLLYPSMTRIGQGVKHVMGVSQSVSYTFSSRRGLIRCLATIVWPATNKAFHRNKHHQSRIIEHRGMSCNCLLLVLHIQLQVASPRCLFAAYLTTPLQITDVTRKHEQTAQNAWDIMAYTSHLLWASGRSATTISGLDRQTLLQVQQTTRLGGCLRGTLKHAALHPQSQPRIFSSHERQNFVQRSAVATGEGAQSDCIALILAVAQECLLTCVMPF